MENKVELSVSLVNGILEYLANKPYKEVFGLISSIQQEAQKPKLADTE